VIDSFAQCPNCGTGQDYKFPDNYQSEFSTKGTFCFCSFQDTIVGDTEERIIKLLQERWSLTEHVVALIRGENK
jgi:hypothetical protein